MLVINKTDKVILTDNENDFVRKIYKPALELLKKEGLDRFMFGEPDYKKTVSKRDDGEMIIEYSAGTAPQLTVNCSFLDDNNNEHNYYLTYYESSTIDRDGIERFSPRRWSFNGIPQKVDFRGKQDLVWFLIFASPEIEEIPELKRYQNQIRAKKAQFKLLDDIKDAKNIAEAKRTVARVSNMIMSGEKDGGFTDDQVKTICMEMGIGTANLTSDQMRNFLHDRVIVRDDRWNKWKMKEVYEFERKYKMERVKDPTKKPVLTDDTEMMAFINELKSKGIIARKGWKWMAGGDTLTTFGPKVSEEISIYDFFKKNPEKVNEFKELLKEPEKVE